MLTPSIPERAAMLAECERSVHAQTCDRWEHLIEIDHEHRGCAITMNTLADAATGEWLLPLADDDLLLPGCLRTLLDASERGDIIYAPPLVWGRAPEPFQQQPPVIPSFALIRRTLWKELGGYDETRIREEDRDLWIKAMRMGAVFVRADSEPTWVYRHHKGNKSFNFGVAA